MSTIVLIDHSTHATNITTHIHVILFIATQWQENKRQHVDTFNIQYFIMLSSFEAAVPITQNVSKSTLQQTSQAQNHNLLHGGDSTSPSNNTLVFTKDLNFGNGSEIIVTGLLNKVDSTMTDLEATF